MSAVRPSRSKYHQRLTLRTRASTVSIILGTLLGLMAWEAASYLLATRTPQGSEVLPSLTTIATSGVLGLGHYYSGGLGISAATAGGDGHALAAGLALLANGLITLGRVLVGLAASVMLGMLLGLAIATLHPLRLAIAGIAELMRMLPALAMAPLFILWFGANSIAVSTFIVFAVTFIVLIATVNAVTNLPGYLIEYPRTLGVSGWRLHSRVMLPAILPEMRGALVFAGLVAWTSVLAAEMNGLQSGLGWMLNDALRFSRIDRMFVIAIVFSAMALATMKLLGSTVSSLTRWND
jgi:sulfonate transport system permease protein